MSEALITLEADDKVNYCRNKLVGTFHGYRVLKPVDIHNLFRFLDSDIVSKVDSIALSNGFGRADTVNIMLITHIENIKIKLRNSKVGDRINLWGKDCL